MPRFEVRLQAQDGSGHFRVTTLNGPELTKEAAREFCEDRERRAVAYRLSPEGLKAADLAQRLLHEQSKPYKVVSVKEA